MHVAYTAHQTYVPVCMPTWISCCAEVSVCLVGFLFAPAGMFSWHPCIQVFFRTAAHACIQQLVSTVGCMFPSYFSVSHQVLILSLSACIQDRNLVLKGTKAFVSFVRAYKEHLLSFLLPFSVRSEFVLSTSSFIVQCARGLTVLLTFSRVLSFSERDRIQRLRPCGGGKRDQ